MNPTVMGFSSTENLFGCANPQRIGRVPVGLLLGGCALAVLAASPARAQTATSAAQETSPVPDQAAAPTSSSSPASPSTQEGNDRTENGDIIVTAQRRDESLSRIGISVSALGANDLTRLGVTKPQDLAGLIPGFQSTSTYGGATTFFIRGVGFNNTNISSTSPVGIYIDQTSLPYGYMAGDVSFDLERVEVLKGPQGTLYGRNTTGGLVNYVTAKPTPDLHAGVTLEVGNYKTINASAFVSGPLSDSVRIRLAANVQNSGDYQYSVTRNITLGQLHSYAGRAIIDFGNGGPFSARLTGMAWHRYGDTQAPQAIFYIRGASRFASPLTVASIIPNPTNNRQADWYTGQDRPYFGFQHPGPGTDATFAAATLSMNYELSPTISIASLTSYDHLKRRDAVDVSGVQIEALSIENTGTIRSVSQELRLIGEGDRLNWSVGAYFSDDHTFEQQRYADNQSVAIIGLQQLALSLPHPNYTDQQILDTFRTSRSAGDNNSNVYAGFANAEYKFNDVFKLGLGGRYTRDKARNKGCSYDINGSVLPIINVAYPVLVGVPLNLQPNGCNTFNSQFTDFVAGGIVARRQSQDNFAFHVTGTITPSDTTLFYGSVSRGFKAGSFPVLGATSERQLDGVKQEQLTAYEVGTKVSLIDRRLQFNAAAFYYDYRDKQIYGRVADLIFGSLARIRNVPKSRIYGVEADARLRLAPSLTAIVAGSYLKSKVLGSYPDFNDLGQPVDSGGRSFAYTPEFSSSGTLLFDQPINDATRINASATVTYQSSSQGDLAGLPQFKIKSYALLNGTIGVAMKSGLEVSLYGSNLANTYYYTGVVSGIDTVFRYAGRPREFGIRLNYKY